MTEQRQYYRNIRVHLFFILAAILVLFSSFKVVASEDLVNIRPDPSGEYQVGFEQFEISQQSTWIQVNAWYPSQSNDGGVLTKYVPPNLAQTYIDQYSVPAEAFDNIEDAWSFSGLPVAEGKFPVLVYNHGYNVYPRADMSRFEFLASHGYIILAISHPGDSFYLERQNGEVIHALKEARVGSIPDSVLESMKQAASLLANATTQEQWNAALVEFKSSHSSLPSGQRFPIWKKNAQLLIDNLEKLNQGHIATLLKGHLDLEAVGAYGHSFGGGLSTILANENEIVKAAINLDGSPANWPIKETLTAPVCNFYATHGDLYPKLNDGLFFANGNKCSVVFNGANHMSFTDFSYIEENKVVDGFKLGNSINRVLKAYFDTELKKQDSWPPKESEFYTYN